MVRHADEPARRPDLHGITMIEQIPAPTPDFG
jgi:hypothetical protein